MYIRGVINQECESLHKIWRNKVTEVSNSLWNSCWCCCSIPVFRNWLIQTIEKTKKSNPLYVHMQKKMQNFSNKWLKTTNSQLSQKRVKTYLRNLTIIARFFYRNNLLFHFYTNKKIEEKDFKRRKKLDSIFFILFFEIALKKVSRGTPSTLSTPQSVYEEDLAEETTEKKIKNLKK